LPRTSPPDRDILVAPVAVKGAAVGMMGCGDCGAFSKMLPIVETCRRVVGGVAYVAKQQALRCKKCGATWHDPDDDAQMQRAIERVARGLDPEQVDSFEVRRAPK